MASNGLSEYSYIPPTLVFRRAAANQADISDLGHGRTLCQYRKLACGRAEQNEGEKERST